MVHRLALARKQPAQLYEPLYVASSHLQRIHVGFPDADSRAKGGLILTMQLGPL
jgi:hypothetical protein